MGQWCGGMLPWGDTNLPILCRLHYYGNSRTENLNCLGWVEDGEGGGGVEEWGWG